ncbi:MAG TPA: DUF433 domain-containing protein [Pyrinomonadaceae bacterium]|nr:DUF433 domain-containing protein [Pyrinomonadaceae bacterium]
MSKIRQIRNINNPQLDIYGGRDPREIPAYRVTDAASYLGIPVTTLRAWSSGLSYAQRDGRRGYFKPVFSLPDSDQSLLSYFNLVEAFVLSSLRKKHLIKLSKIRTAIGSLRKRFNSMHPLAQHEFQTNGVDLFVEEYGQLINLGRGGQIAMRDILEAYLTRVEYDPSRRAAKLYPFIRLTGTDQPRNVVINPYVSFGKPVISGTGLPTRVVAERFKAGDSIPEIAADYGRKEEEIDDAIRYELKIA